MLIRSFKEKIGRNWSFSVDEKEPLVYQWGSQDLEQGRYNFSVHSFNGFYRNFKGRIDDPNVVIDFKVQSDQTATVIIKNQSSETLSFYVQDVVYSKENQKINNTSLKQNIH